MDRPIEGEGIPGGWRVEQWAAFQSLQEGGSYADAARAAGRSVSSVSRWVRRWRDRWGDDVVQTGERPIGRSDVGAQRAGELAILKHADRRLQLSLGQSLMASKLHELTELSIQEAIDDPERRKEWGPSEWYLLARSIDVLTKRADLLSDIPSADRMGPIQFQQNLGAGIQAQELGVDLSGLEQETEGGEVQELLLAVQAISERFGSGEVIDVEESADE